MTHVKAYGELAEAGLGDTRGVWNAGDGRAEPFLYSNPSRLLEVSDRQPDGGVGAVRRPGG